MDASMGYVRRLSTKTDLLDGFDLANAQIEKDENGLVIRLNNTRESMKSRRRKSSVVDLQDVVVSRKSSIIESRKSSVKEKSASIDNIEVQKEKLETESDDWKLLYKISDSPPIFLTILFAFQMQGSLILAGAIHMLIGLTGFVGILLKVVGPLTVVPTLLLLGIEFYSVMNSFCEPHWGLAAGTCLISIIFSVYLNGWNMPIPMYTRELGVHFIRYPLQQVLAILFSIMIGWSICGILTYSGLLTTDPDNKQFKTRTDYGSDTIQNTPWFTMPYPGQFGAASFNTGIFIAFFIATLLSVIESIADYYACARLSHVPPPPIAAMNRGIMVEGFMSMMAGFFGAGHATTTYSNNIGLIGMTKVASRRVFQLIGVQLIICAVIGKLGAVFVTIPYPVLGGSGIISFGLFMGVIMSYLQFTDMNSPRNLAVVGVALLTGLMVPNWVKANSEVIKTGSDEFDKFLIMSLTNPSLFGGFVAFIFDNTIRGTKRERGLVAWSLGESQSGDGQEQTEESLDVYEIPLLTQFLDKLPCCKFLPVFPTYSPEIYQCKKTEPSESNHTCDVAEEVVMT